MVSPHVGKQNPRRGVWGRGAYSWAGSHPVLGTALAMATRRARQGARVRLPLRNRGPRSWRGGGGARKGEGGGGGDVGGRGGGGVDSGRSSLSGSRAAAGGGGNHPPRPGRSPDDVTAVLCIVGREVFRQAAPSLL